MRALHFLKTLGAGSFGTVYLAEFSSDQGFRRNVAVKVLLNGRPDEEMFLSRIRDEARLLGLAERGDVAGEGDADLDDSRRDGDDRHA